MMSMSAPMLTGSSRYAPHEKDEPPKISVIASFSRLGAQQVGSVETGAPI